MSKKENRRHETAAGRRRVGWEERQSLKQSLSVRLSAAPDNRVWVLVCFILSYLISPSKGKLWRFVALDFEIPKERQGNERRIKRFKLDDKQVKEVLMAFLPETLPLSHILYIYIYIHFGHHAVYQWTHSWSGQLMTFHPTHMQVLMFIFHLQRKGKTVTQKERSLVFRFPVSWIFLFTNWAPNCRLYYMLLL